MGLQVQELNQSFGGNHGLDPLNEMKARNNNIDCFNRDEWDY